MKDILYIAIFVKRFALLLRDVKRSLCLRVGGLYRTRICQDRQYHVEYFCSCISIKVFSNTVKKSQPVVCMFVDLFTIGIQLKVRIKFVTNVDILLNDRDISSIVRYIEVSPMEFQGFLYTK